MNDDYKASKEAFVSGMTGSTIGHINLVSLASLLSIALHSAVRTRCPQSRSFQFLTEAFLLIVPLLLSVTIFASSPVVLCLFLAAPTGLILLLPRRESGTWLPSSLKHSRQSSRASNPSRDTSPPKALSIAIPPLPALTTYRAHMLLLTFICILAVDFPVFPRFLAKCETYGVSIVRPSHSLLHCLLIKLAHKDGHWRRFLRFLSRNRIRDTPSQKPFAPYPTSPPEAHYSPAEVLAGPCARTVEDNICQGNGVSKYGVHWNFFITLGLLPILQVLLHPLIVYVPVSLLGLVVAISHQLALSAGRLEQFILHAPRVGVVSANKEGLISMSGYLAIHLLGLSTGTLLLAPSPSYFRRQQQQIAQQAAGQRPTLSDTDTDDDVPSPISPATPASPSPTLAPAPSSRVVEVRRENDKTATELCSYAVLWWVLLGALRLANVGGGVSRRMANLQYVVWIAAYNATFILGYLVLDLAFFASPLSRSVYSPTSKLKLHPDPRLLSATRVGAGGGGERRRETGAGIGTEAGGGAQPLLEAINKNGLVLFLLANVATGLINLSMQTMYASDWAAMVVLTLYSVGVSAVAWACRYRKIWRF